MEEVDDGGVEQDQQLLSQVILPDLAQRQSFKGYQGKEEGGCLGEVSWRQRV